jgi:hypothetical protein
MGMARHNADPVVSWRLPLAWLSSPGVFCIMFLTVMLVSVAHPDRQTRRYWTAQARKDWGAMLRLMVAGAVLLVLLPTTSDTAPAPLQKAHRHRPDTSWPAGRWQSEWPGGRLTIQFGGDGSWREDWLSGKCYVGRWHREPRPDGGSAAVTVVVTDWRDRIGTEDEAMKMYFSKKPGEEGEHRLSAYGDCLKRIK